MASIARRPDGRWRARYRDETGREYAGHFARKVDAQRWLDRETAKIVTGTWVNPRAGRVTFAEYAEGWRAVQVHRPTTQAHVETMLRRHAYPVFGPRPLSSIRPSEVQAWTSGLALTPSSAEVCFRYFSAVFKAAVSDRVIASSPCAGIRLPRRLPRQVVPLTTDQVQALTAAMPARFRALVVMAAGTGLRQGEAFGLEVRHVDFLRRTLRVEQQLVTLPGAPPQVSPPKTDSSYRTIPLPQVVVDALAAHLRDYPSAGLIFTAETGEPIRRSSFSGKAWRRAVQSAGLPTGVGFHALRHYYASLLIRHGESVKVVQLRLGHATAAETLDTYAHLWPDSEDRTRAAIDSVLGPAADFLRTGRVADKA